MTAERSREESMAHLQTNESIGAIDETAPAVTQEKKRKNHRRGRKKKNKQKGVAEARRDAIPTDTDAGNCKVLSRSDGLNINAENEMYEIRHTDGKGLGVFAKRDIERGTRIMCEEPLISIENKDDVTGMIQGFILLDPDQKALFLSLHRGNDEAREALIETVVRERHGSCMDKVSGMPIQWQVRITRAFDVNSFQKIKGSAIYPKASRLNHSCTPNVNHFWNSSLGRETVTTTRDVKVGEEILISYVRLCRTREQRHEQLQPYGFRCICLACDASTPFGRASENRRKTISALDQSLAMYRQFPKLSPLPGDRAAIRAAMTLSEVFIEEGLDGMDLQRW